MMLMAVRSGKRWGRWLVLASLITAASTGSAWALIMGGEGNKPVNDPGWPKGAAAVFNIEGRVAYWEGPPFGGGQWHAECRGDALALSLVLDDFAKIETPKKRVVVHDGIGHSFWLNPNREKEKLAKSMIDWTFTIWQQDRLKFQQNLPAHFRAVHNNQQVVVAQLDVYTGGFVRWVDVIVPKGLEVVDERLEAHGFSVEDGNVLEGKAVDLATQKPIAAKLILEKYESAPEGGYRYTSLAEAQSDAAGHWVLKHAPAGQSRMVLTADGYVPRVIGYVQLDDRPRWSEHHSGLSKPAAVTGRVVDDQDQPLADVDVRLDTLGMSDGTRYDVAGETNVKTDADGRFSFAQVPIGSGAVWIHKPGYVRPGLGPNIETPITDLKLAMQPAAELQVRVDFSATQRPEGYIVHVEPEGGERVGKWSGDGNINDDAQITYKGIPAGRYVITGRPNPGSENQTTEPLTVDLQRGKTTEVTLKAK